jgi:dienelactone hydrolase
MTQTSFQDQWHRKEPGDGLAIVALAFDASHQGMSGGMPRLLDDPMRRVGDIYSAVDYLTSLRYVDSRRIGALGICAGSGTTVKAASMERRIKALATVSAVDVGAAVRKGWEGSATAADQLALLESIEGATHMDLYDRDAQKVAATHLAPFFKRALSA